jgi:hypothetical protein
MTTEKKTGNKEDWAKAKSTKERTFREIETEFFKFEKPEATLEGYLVDVSSQRMRNNSDGSPNVIGRYKLQKETEGSEPEYVEFLGGSDLDAKMKGVELNDFVRITYTGNNRTSQGNNMKLYRVEVAE